jgi:hypothetical protein
LGFGRCGCGDVKGVKWLGQGGIRWMVYCILSLIQNGKITHGEKLQSFFRLGFEEMRVTPGLSGRNCLLGRRHENLDFRCCPPSLRTELFAEKVSGSPRFSVGLYCGCSRNR